MAYNKTNWVDGGTYGADAFNNIENGITELDKAINEGGVAVAGYNKKQSDNMSKALKKLRTNTETEICFMGDSVFYGFDLMNEDGDAVPETCVPDIGLPLEGFTRSPITIYDTFMKAMNDVYENKIKLKKKIYTGDTAWTAFYRWNPCLSDFIIINFGINDALGSHVNDSYHPELPANYKSDVNLYIKAMRKLVEREIDNGTAVILLSPTKLTLTTSATDTDNRIMVDIYEQAMINIGAEYGCPVINGNEMVQNFGNDMAIDFCHFTKEGFRAIGHRLASVFIGQSPYSPLEICGERYLGVNPTLDNINIVAPTLLDSSDLSPNIPTMIRSADLGENVNRVTGGLQAVIVDGGKLVWSFYAKEEGMVVVPLMYTVNTSFQVNVSVDFGAKQGKWSNYWKYVSNTGIVDRDYNEPSSITIGINDMENYENGKRYGLHLVNNSAKPVLKLTSKGWHTISITIEPVASALSVPPPIPVEGSLCVYGIDIIPFTEYKKLTTV